MGPLLENFKPYDAQIVSFILTLLTAIVFWIAQARVKLRWGFQHGFSHRIDPAPRNEKGEDNSDSGPENMQPIMVRTASFWIANEGRRTASNVEITFNYRPDNFSIWPQRNYETVPNPEGRLIFKFASVSPKEAFTINLITIGSDVPDLLSMRSDEASGRKIPIIFVKKFSNKFYAIMAFFIATGFFSTVYIFVSLLI